MRNVLYVSSTPESNRPGPNAFFHSIQRTLSGLSENAKRKGDNLCCLDITRNYAMVETKEKSFPTPLVNKANSSQQRCPVSPSD